MYYIMYNIIYYEELFSWIKKDECNLFSAIMTYDPLQSFTGENYTCATDNVYNTVKLSLELSTYNKAKIWG